MAKYRKRPIVVEAVQATERTVIKTLEGDTATAQVGDWIITGTRGEQWPCNAEVFAETYDPVGQPTGDIDELMALLWHWVKDTAVSHVVKPLYPAIAALQAELTGLRPDRERLNKAMIMLRQKYPRVFDDLFKPWKYPDIRAAIDAAMVGEGDGG